MEESPIKSRFRLGGSPELDPLLRLVQEEAGRAPALVLSQLERLIGAGVANGKAEQARLAKRYDKTDPRGALAAEQTQTMGVLLDLIGDLKSDLDMETEAMTVTGFLMAKGEMEEHGFDPAGKTVEIVDTTYNIVYARTITDGRGRFAMTLGPPGQRTDELIPIAHDEDDMIARGKNFAFEPGQTLDITLFASTKAKDERDRLWRAEERKRAAASDANLR